MASSQTGRALPPLRSINSRMIKGVNTQLGLRVHHMHISRNRPTRALLQAIYQPKFTSCRYASTSAAADSSLRTGATSLEDSNASDLTSDWTLPADGLNNTMATSQPHLGYLKELGLDFGWGPTSLVQWSMEHLHVSFDLPIWAAAIGVTALVRLLVLPLAFEASDMSARMKAVSPRMNPVRERMTEAMASGDKVAQIAAQRELQMITREAKIKLSAMFRPLLIQAPIGFGLFRLTRAMSDLPVPGLDVAGFSWLTNLTVPDPFFVLPIATSGLLYISLKQGFQDNGTPTSGMGQSMMKVLPFLTLGATSWLPALTQLGFFSAAAMQFGQTEALRNAKIREKFGLHPMEVPKADSTESYRGTMTFEESMHQSAPPQEPNGLFAKAIKAPTEAIKSLKSSTSKLMQQAKSMQDKKHTRLSASELKSAKSYEASRNKEEKTAEEERRSRERRKRLNKLD